MLVVRVEIWPGGDPRPLRQIAVLCIVNVGPESDGRFAYEARNDGRIARLVHDRADGALTLVARAIDALAGGSVPDPKAEIPDSPTASPHLPLPNEQPDAPGSTRRSHESKDMPSSRRRRRHS